MQVMTVGNVVIGSTCIDAAKQVRGVASSVTFGVAINGWFIFLSLVAAIFQAVATVDLFTHIKLFYIKIPISGSLWYLIMIAVSSFVAQRLHHRHHQTHALT